MNWSDFANKKVALLGAGKENLSLIPLLKEAQADISIRQQTSSQEIQNKLDQYKDINIVIGNDWLEGLGQYDYVFRTPSLPVEKLRLALDNLEKKPQVTSPMNLLLSLKPCKIIGVTGTKGKGTTSTLIYQILKAANKDAYLAGNIGNSIFDDWKLLKPESFAVMEMSSFQLEDIQCSPDVAVILPIVPDHLLPLSLENPNYHHSFEAYVEAKAQITLHQDPADFLVYATDNEATLSIAKRSPAQKLAVSMQSDAADMYVTEEGKLFWQGNEYLDLSTLGLSGRHVFLNSAIAVGVARQLSISKEDILTGLKNFKPLPHRLEIFAHQNGISFVDDSYATAPDATIAAFTAFKTPIVWIAGGSSKGADFTELAHSAKTINLRCIVLIGQEAKRIETALREVGINDIVHAESIEDAVNQAYANAKPGDTVLLSPACASKDMFKNAAERGDQFKQLINAKLL